MTATWTPEQDHLTTIRTRPKCQWNRIFGTIDCDRDSCGTRVGPALAAQSVDVDHRQIVDGLTFSLKLLAGHVLSRNLPASSIKTGSRSYP
jgi:hypothetical protein